MTLSQFLTIAGFLGDDITDEQASRLMNSARQSLSLAEIELCLEDIRCAGMYLHLSMYKAEMSRANAQSN